MNRAIDKALFYKNAAKILPDLKKKKQEEDPIAFNELVGMMLEGIKRYLGRRLKYAVQKKVISAGKYDVNDFLDELYILAYEHIQDVKEDQNLYRWLFRKADEIFEEAVIEEEFDHTFFENIDDFGEAELDAMEENFSTDGDGDLVMEEELDDLSYPKFDYTLQDVFVENQEKEIIEKLEKDLTQERINQQFDQLLHQLPAPNQAVFELNVQQMSVEDIAEIRNIPATEVIKHLGNTRKWIRRNFMNKYRFSELK